MLPSVVELATGTGLGSGIVFDKRGAIVTNPLVGNATSFQVGYANTCRAGRTRCLAGGRGLG